MTSPPSAGPSTLHELLAAHADSPVACLVEDDRAISWAELSERTRAVAGGLARCGVEAGDRVAIWLPNRSAWLVSFLACAQLGAIAVSINTRFRSGEVGDLLRRSASKLLVYWPGYKAIDFEGILAACDSDSLAGLDRVVLYTEGDEAVPRSVAGKPVVAFGELLSAPALHESAGRPESPCVIFTTSGTTKAPKLVLHDQRHVLSHAFNVARQYALAPQHRFLLVPPFCGVYGFCSAMAALAAATPLMLCRPGTRNAARASSSPMLSRTSLRPTKRSRSSSMRGPHPMRSARSSSSSRRTSTRCTREWPSAANREA